MSVLRAKPDPWCEPCGAFTAHEHGVDHDECMTCHAETPKRALCPLCTGSGALIVTAYDPDGGLSNHTTRCRRCGGLGWVDR